MKGKAFSLAIMVVSLLVSTILIGTVYGWGYTQGAGTKFRIEFDPPYYDVGSNGTYWEVPPPFVGEKFNVTVYMENVTKMLGYVFTMVWNNSFCNATGNIWDYNVWGAPSGGLIGFGYFLDSVGDIGYLDNAGNGLKNAWWSYNLTGIGPYPLLTIEFHVEAHGDNWFYIYKQSGSREPEFAFLGLTPSGWFRCDPVTPIGESEPYDVYWVPGYENVSNALLARRTVGGISIPVDKLALLAPYIALASTILAATAATAIYVKRRKKKQ